MAGTHFFSFDNKYWDHKVEGEQYPLLDWINTIYEDALLPVLKKSVIRDVIPNRFVLSGRSDPETKDWRGDVGMRTGLDDTVAVFLSPNKFVRNTSFTFVDYIDETHEITYSQSKYKNDETFFASLRGEYTPKVVVMNPEPLEDEVETNQRIMFEFPLNGDSTEAVVALFNIHCHLLKEIKKNYKALIPKDSLLNDRYIVKSANFDMSMDSAKKMQTFVGNYRGIQLSSPPPRLYIICDFRYLDEAAKESFKEKSKKL